jgi:hypothetical protein
MEVQEDAESNEEQQEETHVHQGHEEDQGRIGGGGRPKPFGEDPRESLDGRVTISAGRVADLSTAGLSIPDQRSEAERAN